MSQFEKDFVSPTEMLAMTYKPHHDAINPSHYKFNGFDSSDVSLQVCERYKSKESPLVFNILKYVMRAPRKNGIEDLKKAQWYLNKLIEVYNVEE